MSMQKMSKYIIQPIEWIRVIITDNGVGPLYTVWDKHGEPALPTPPLQATPTPPPLMSDMTALLDDLSYIPPNNEHNEPTQGDIGYKACPTCNEETPSIGVKNKIAYVGHRRFLRKPHKWRSSREFNGDTDHRDPPKEYPRDVILAQHARLLTRVPGKHPKHGGVKIKRNVEVELNWTKRSIFYELEYWSFISLRHNLDIMHIEKNVLEAILNTLLMNDKSKDTAKARQDLQNLGIRRPLWTKPTRGRCEA
ncbi:zinc finger, PHD-type containing protein [Tanacetum coccineum]